MWLLHPETVKSRKLLQNQSSLHVFCLHVAWDFIFSVLYVNVIQSYFCNFYRSLNTLIWKKDNKAILGYRHCSFLDAIEIRLWNFEMPEQRAI